MKVNSYDGVFDRMQSRMDIFNYVESMGENVVVVRVKIEDFEEFENYFGQKLSLKMQDKFSKKLFKMMPKECNYSEVFILGNGEYVLLRETESYSFDRELSVEYIKKFQQNVRNAKIHIKHIDYDVSIIVSMAFGEKALENAKYGLRYLEESRGSFIIAKNFVENVQKRAKKNLRTLQMVKRALENDSIISYFQGIVNNRTGEIEKYESLVRLVDEEQNVIAPYFFLDIAKKGKYYAQITSRVLENAFNALYQLEGEISVNLSLLDIEDKFTRVRIFELLNLHKREAHRIIFELLEDESVKNFKIISKFISNVKRSGAKIAIDDFGSGYSNFVRLLEYQPDIVKLDGSLIKNIMADAFSFSIVKSMVSFAKDQNIKVVAEFVENEEIYNYLCKLGVDYSQGYYFCEPKALEYL